MPKDSDSKTSGYASESPGGLVSKQVTGPGFIASHPVVVERGPILCISNKFLGDANGNHLRTTAGEPLL